MALLQENKYLNGFSVFPNWQGIDASGVGTVDGSEIVALNWNDGWEQFQQSYMNFADGGTNNPTGSVGVPNGVSEAKGINQMIQAVQRAHGVGPGTYVQLDNDYDPVAKGDRIIILSEQGVLISVYPDLDRERWIGGNTAAQIAAIAAGEKFYRSSDSGGATGDAAGPYLQLPANNLSFRKSYSQLSGNFTISGTNWTTTGSFAIPFQISSGAWFMHWGCTATLSAKKSNQFVGTFSGITFGGVSIALAAHLEDSGVTTQRDVQRSVTVGGTGTFQIVGDGVNNYDIIAIQGLSPLSSKPTWADAFANQLGIRY